MAPGLRCALNTLTPSTRSKARLFLARALLALRNTALRRGSGGVSATRTAVRSDRGEGATSICGARNRRSEQDQDGFVAKDGDPFVNAGGSLSNTNHEEDQPIHLRLKDSAVPIRENLPKYGEPARLYCPPAFTRSSATTRRRRRNLAS